MTEFFDPISPHIGYSGREFDPPEGISFDSPFLRDAGKSFDDGVGEKIDTAPSVMTAQKDAAESAALAAAAEEQNLANATKIAEANEAIGSKAEPKDVPTDVPGWMSLNPVEDVVFPRADLKPLPTIVNAKTSTQVDDNGGTHRHNHQATISWADPVYTTALDRLDIGYINATRDRVYNTVGLVIAAQTVANPAIFTVHVYKMGKTAAGRPNGELALQWSSPPQEGSFGSGASDVRVEIGYDLVAKKGDWFAVVVHQTGAGRTPRNLLGGQTAGIAAMPGVHPSRLGMNRSGQAYAPSTLVPAQLDTSSTWIPWVCLGQTFGLVKVAFVDLFDRADAPSLGVNWSVFGVGMDVRNGVAQCKRINYGTFATRTDFTRAVYVSQLSTDSESVSVKITGFDRSNANLEENPRAQAALRSNADMTRAVTVGIRWGILEIRAYTDTNPSGKTMNSREYAWSAGDRVELRVTDKYDDTQNPPQFQYSQYLVKVNGADAIDWKDVYHEVSSGPGFRRQGFETANVHRGAIFGYIHIPSVGINEWKANDL
ncbi:hypothetical protein A6F55_23905 [Prescottella equi]|uniref:hypothetical protein n=1 Tax=Rhodococcus hoagii TaxID=43767 RepID=UPI000A0FA747|nr:hypothetical protein [Prescottella equi]ORJ92610.1 hypothetical protein A6F55_23905 [Prescottella equi]